MPPMDERSRERGALRASGLLVMFVLVVTGVGVTAGYLRWKAPEVGEIIAARRREIAATPSTPEGRLSKWLEFGAPQIHHRLEMMRFSSGQPWLVTHAVGTDPQALAIHGIDLAAMPKGIARLDGPTVRVKVPLPRRLGVGPLRGDNALSVPVYASDAAVPDPIERARFLLGFALDGLSQALERDIPGARLAIEVGPEESWEAIAGSPSAPPR
jgi:catechol 2,3-dioxygenase-like lactoylglutathione lyase family enzyme